MLRSEFRHLTECIETVCGFAHSCRLMSSDHRPEDHRETDALDYILLSQGRAFCSIGKKIVKMLDLDDRGKYPECHFT